MKIVTSLRRAVPAMRLDLAAVAALAITLATGFSASAGEVVITTTTLEPTTTTEEPTTTTTTLVIKGACCTGSNCYDNKTEDYCIGELSGTWHGEASSCEDPGLCVNCGDGCKQYGESCDDGDTANGDGCDEKCGEEACYKCFVAQSDTRNVIVPFCFGPSTCVFDEKCGFCGDGVTGPGELCDDGDTVSADCCDEECMPVQAGTDCSDDTFCDGPESCDGSGSCVDGEGNADCSGLDDECTLGVCDSKADTCVTDTSAKNGQQCDDPGLCATNGECLDGDCVGDSSTLAPSCRWIVCAGSGSGDVRVRTGDGSTMNANACGDTAKWAGITTASIVAGATTGEGVYFYGPPEVAGDIVTGGSTVGTSLYITIPGTDVKDVATGLTVAKDPLGEVDTTGLHDLVDVCNDDQAALTAAIPILNGMGDTGDPEAGGPNGLKIPVGSSDTIDITGQGVAIVDTNGLKVGKNGTLTLRGSATDVLLLRVGGRLKLGYGSRLVLEGLTPGNVAIYGTGPRCRLSPGTRGAGTVFCPDAGRFIVGAGVRWSGTFLGGVREVQVRSNAALLHVAFTGF